MPGITEDSQRGRSRWMSRTITIATTVNEASVRLR